MNLPRYRKVQVGGCLTVELRTPGDGTQRLHSPEALLPYPRRLTDQLELWAAQAPNRSLVARRANGQGDWVHLSYAQMLGRVQRVGQALLDLGLSVERPLLILSDNDLEHLTLALAAMWVGVPYTPVSPAYSLLSQDFDKLRHIVGRTTPGMVFAADARFAKAIAATVAAEVPVALTEGLLAERSAISFAELLAIEPGPAVAAAHARVGPDSIAKILFTSGSTQAPKGVINTQRMLCANQQMLAQAMPFLAEAPPVLVDWLPWSHTFGGNQNCGLTLFHGGTLYIDEGKPTPAGMALTLRNLREIAPTVYFSVPKGYEELVKAMEADTALRDHFFSRVKALKFAGAGLAQNVWDGLDALAEAACGGERVAIFCGLGMTETAPTCMLALRTGGVRSGHVGLPVPGVEIKLVTEQPGPHAKTELRLRGPNITPGYWREPALTAAAFDSEGFYRTGDALRWVDTARPDLGLLFDGRTAEDFKLSTGTFVSVGPLRARITAETSPCVLDVVITGLNRAEIGALLFPRLDECRRLAGLPADSEAHFVLRHPTVRAFFGAAAERLWQAGTGSASRVTRLLLLAEPPSPERGEITDKGSINQRVVLGQRATLVDALYSANCPDLIQPTSVQRHPGDTP